MQKNSRIIASVAFLFFLSLVLTAYSVRNPHVTRFGSVFYQTLTAPFQYGLHSGWGKIASVWTSYIWLVEAEAENQSLRTELSQIRAEVVRLRELSLEARTLREILMLRNETGYEGVVASVIGFDPSGWVRSVTIDKGKRDGLLETSPAIRGGAVVGQVSATANHSSQVLLLTDRSSGVAALVQRSRARGVLLGTGTDDCALEYVGEEEDVVVGDLVVTSGMDGIFPKGLEVGQVARVRERDGEMFKTITVRPSADLAHLETVFILTQFGRESL